MRALWMTGVLLLAACNAAERTSTGESPAAASTTATLHAGWYLEHAGQSRFQPCGQSESLRISDAADLPARAKAFGLDEDTPVYVRVKGTLSGNELQVVAVEQFGSPTPVRDCGLTGVAIPPEGR